MEYTVATDNRRRWFDYCKRKASSLCEVVLVFNGFIATKMTFGCGTWTGRRRRWNFHNGR